MARDIEGDFCEVFIKLVLLYYDNPGEPPKTMTEVPSWQDIVEYSLKGF